MEELLRLAKEEFADITDAEVKLIKSVAGGEPADYSSQKELENDPAKSNIWNDSRIIQSDKIIWLCTNENSLKFITRNGIQIKCARIEGELDLQFINISFPLSFSRCAFTSLINLFNSQIGLLNLNGSHTKIINAAGVIVNGGVFLGDGFVSDGQIKFIGAVINGQLNCNGGYFRNKENIALFADGITVTSHAIFREKFRCEGEFRLLGAKVRGNLECDSAQFINPSGKTFFADGINIAGSLHLRKDLISGSEFRSEGELRLINATIGGNLDCSGGKFINDFNSNDSDSVAIFADGLRVKSIYFRNEFEAKGILRISGSIIFGSLECDSSKFHNHGGISLRADRIRVEGDVYFRYGFQSEGELVMTGATITGNLECDGGIFKNTGEVALSLENISVGGHVFLRENFDCEGSINLTTSKIEGALVWNGVLIKENCELDLRSASIRVLKLDIQNLPSRGNLDLNNLVYDEFLEENKLPVEEYYNLLDRQVNGYFPQPYEQLARVLRIGGREDIATKILIRKNEEEYAKLKYKFSKMLKFYLLKWTLGFGYKTLRPLIWSLGFIIFGSIVFSLADNSDIISPTINSLDDLESQNISNEFHPFVYSIDTFIPFIDLYQADIWIPEGGIVLLYLYIHIIMGWIFITLFIVGLSGIIKK